MKIISPTFKFLVFKIITICIIVVYLQLALNQPAYLIDFRTFYAAALALRTEPQNLYNPQTQIYLQNNVVPPDSDIPYYKEIIPYFNPPFFLLPYLPLTFIDIVTAYRIALGVQALITVAALLLLDYLFPRPTHKLHRILLAATFASIYFAAINTQSSIFTLFIASATYLALRQRRFFLAGLISSILLYKPQLGLIIYLFLLFQRQKHLIFGMIIGGIFFLGLSYLLVGNHLFDLIAFTRDYSTVRGTSPLQQITWFGLLRQINLYLAFLPVNGLGILLSLSTIVISFWHILKHKSTSPAAYSLVLITTLLATGHVHYQETVLLLFPFFWITQQASLTYKQIGFCILTWLTFLFCIFSPFFPDPLPFVPTITLCILWVATLKTLRQAPTYES